MPHKVRIFKERFRGHSYYKMWRGGCTCGYDVQYWNFGATFGTMIYHQWKMGSIK